MTIVEIKREVKFVELKTALSEAAKDVGWTADFRDQYVPEYHLGSVRKIQQYQHTDVVLTQDSRNMLCIYRLDRNSPTDWFTVGAWPLSMIHATEEQVQQYLDAVSKHLLKSPPPSLPSQSRLRGLLHQILRKN